MIKSVKSGPRGLLSAFSSAGATHSLHLTRKSMEVYAEQKCQGCCQVEDTQLRSVESQETGPGRLITKRSRDPPGLQLQWVKSGTRQEQRKEYLRTTKVCQDNRTCSSLALLRKWFLHLSEEVGAWLTSLLADMLCRCDAKSTLFFQPPPQNPQNGERTAGLSTSTCLLHKVHRTWLHPTPQVVL